MEGTFYFWCSSCKQRRNANQRHDIPEYDLRLCADCYPLFTTLEREATGEKGTVLPDTPGQQL
jgi:hypothetical protein